jgi:hypothetical protein
VEACFNEISCCKICMVSLTVSHSSEDSYDSSDGNFVVRNP